jgi:transcriptional regulator with GAF, ATPase, and Fis domain
MITNYEPLVNQKKIFNNHLKAILDSMAQFQHQLIQKKEKNHNVNEYVEELSKMLGNIITESEKLSINDIKSVEYFKASYLKSLAYVKYFAQYVSNAFKIFLEKELQSKQKKMEDLNNQLSENESSLEELVKERLHREENMKNLKSEIKKVGKHSSNIWLKI